MHNLAIELKNKGHQITGSDDEIFEPSRTYLEKQGLLPQPFGWYDSRISKELDVVILGMHATTDNPELLKAQNLGLKIYSYPEYLFEQTKSKKRVVIAGSHGKTTITALVVHVLHNQGVEIDFMVGSRLEGFDNMVSLNDKAEIAVFEGDEYLSSPIDTRPKFLHYKPEIALISGIAWDHINVFPTYPEYVEQFRKLVEQMKPGSHLVYYRGDEVLDRIARSAAARLQLHPYAEHNSKISDDTTYLITPEKEELPVKLFGAHNMQNINGAKSICNILGLTDRQFYNAVKTFPGTSKRLQVLSEKESYISFLDFAHSPSKVKATLQAVRDKYPDRKIHAVLELHTFSSLNRDFIPQYSGALDRADEAVVYYEKSVLEHKKLPMLSGSFVTGCFGRKDLIILNQKKDLEFYLGNIEKRNAVLLLMSSGNFSGIKLY